MNYQWQTRYFVIALGILLSATAWWWLGGAAAQQAETPDRPRIVLRAVQQAGVDQQPSGRTTSDNLDANENSASVAQVAAFGACTYTVTNTNDSGAGSLRQAILDNNAGAGGGRICFKIPSGSGTVWKTITPSAGGLPYCEKTVFLDGWSQGGASYIGFPLIEINGINAPGENGLVLRGNGNIVRGFAINRFAGGSGNGFGMILVGKDNWIYGNHIGTDPLGNSARGNGQGGIFIGDYSASGISFPANNIIGTNADGVIDSAEGNVISANSVTSESYGIAIYLYANNTIAGNHIGVNADGTSALGAQQKFGLWFWGAKSNLIGGTQQVARNVIANNRLAVSMTQHSDNNLVQGNYVGTAASGNASIPNGYGLDILGSTGNTIGGTTTGARNVIAGNDGEGVGVWQGADNTTIQGNYIGVGADGSTALGNKGDDGSGGRGRGGGIAFFFGQSNCTVGGTAAGAGNLIANNSPNGISVNRSGTGHRILGNRIFNNISSQATEGIGIDLAGSYGVTPNDNNDADNGVNNLQNFPVLTNISPTGVISGALDSLPARTAYPVRLEFFANGSCDATGYGEGEVFMGAMSINGPGNFTSPAFGVNSNRLFITATATDANGNTSEFSACRRAAVPEITATGVTRTAGGPVSNSVIAQVSDPPRPPATLTVQVDGSTSSTRSGITVSNLTTNLLSGTVQANVVATCSAAASATFVLTANDSRGFFSRSTLTVTVNANTAPTLSYSSPQTVTAGGALNVSPTTVTDNGTITGFSIVSVTPSLLTTPTISASGVISISNAGPTGSYNITARATDNCGQATDAAFTLNVTCTNLSISLTSQALAANGGSGSFTVSGDCNWTALSEAPAWLMITSPGSGSGSGTVSFTAAANTGGPRSGTITIAGRTFTVNQAGAKKVKSDFDGDGKTDLGVWRGQQGLWFIRQSANNSDLTINWGLQADPYNDVAVPGDYDGDQKTDAAVWRPAEGHWYIKRSSDNATQTIAWGAGSAPYNDVTVPGDYDGDGKTDVAVWRPAEGNWYILNSSDGSSRVQQWGAGYAPYNDLPVAADYDGDGKTDPAVFRRSNGHWFVLRSSDNAVLDQQWGTNGDVPVVGDYDGDGKADIAVWRPSDGTWYVLRSSNNSVLVTNWGLSAAPYNDIAVPGDYDGDGKTDIAVWRPLDATWYVIKSTDGSYLIQVHGTAGDTPAPAIGVR